MKEGTVAKWPLAPLVRENNRKPKAPRLAAGLGEILKRLCLGKGWKKLDGAEIEPRVQLLGRQPHLTYSGTFLFGVSSVK